MFIERMINDAFRSRKDPPGITEICPYEASDEDVAQRVRSFFANREWKDINNKELNETFGHNASGAFYYMGWKSLFYYTPAIILISLEGIQDTGPLSFLPNSIFLNERYYVQGDDRQLLERLALFSRDQLYAIYMSVIYINVLRREVISEEEYEFASKIIKISACNTE